MNIKKYYYIDFIRIFSMLSVIFLHSAADLLRVDYYSPVWHFSNVLTTLCSSSVPLFFMISGAMLLSNDKSKSICHLYKVRIKKILVPFLFWSLFAIAYYFAIDFFYYNNANYSDVIYRLKHLIGQPVSIHFWFMYALIPIYILLPFIKTLIDNIEKKKVIYLFILWLVFSVLLPTLQSIVTSQYKMIFKMDAKFNLSLFGGYLGFFILGYYLHNFELKIRKRWLLTYIITIVFLVSLGTYLGTRLTGGYFENFKTYSCFFTASLSVSIYLLFKELFKNKNEFKIKKVVCKISEASFFIYLVHNLLINFMNVNYIIVPDGSILNLILRFLSVFIISFILFVILTHIKPLSFIMTGVSYKGLTKNEKN